MKPSTLHPLSSLITLAFLLAFAPPLNAEIDMRRISLSSEYADPVAWLNVEGPPYWVAGSEPHYSYADRSHRVELSPGEEVQLIVPTGEGVLVKGDSQDIGSLEWSTSNGSGLWANAIAEKTTYSDQALLPFSIWNTRLVSIRHPAEKKEAIQVELYVSRRDRGTKIRFERKTILLDAPRRTLLLGLQPQAGPLYELAAGGEWSVEVEGPHRFLLEHRVFYPHDVSDRRFSYRVELRAGERSSESEFVAFPEVRNWSTVSGRTHVVGRLMRSYLDVPAGSHRLTIRTDAPLLARLLGPFDELRASWAQEAEATTLGSAWLSDWSTLLEDAVSDPRSNAHQRALLRIARDNRRIDAGLVAAERAVAEARSRPNIPSLRRFAQTLAIAKIGYRGLPARRDETPSLEESRSYVYITSGIRSPVDDRDRYVLGAQHATSLRRQTLSGRFVPLPAAEEELRYFLPERSASSRLRLALQPRGPAGDACRLNISLGEDRSVDLRTGSVPSPSLLDVGAAAVATSLQTAGVDITGDVAGLGWSSETSSAEFELPKSTQVIRLRATNCEGRRVAMAYGTGRRDSMNEAEYRAAVNAIGGPTGATRLFSAALENLDQLLDGTIPLATAVGEAAGERAWPRAASARLLNHWIPSLQLIRARDIAYRHHVGAIDHRSTDTNTPTELEQDPQHHQHRQRRLQAMREIAIDLEATGDWLAAYEGWMKVAAAGPEDAAGPARLRGADALLASGESRLAATILKSEVLHGLDEGFRTRAFERLARVYHEQGNDVQLEGLFASRAISTTGEARSDALARLSDLALELGKETLALRLDLVLPAAHFNRARRTEAAYLNGWWTTFEESLMDIAPEAANRWNGYRAQQAGDFRAARRQWRKADDSGKAALAALNRALSIRDDLVDGSSQARNQALQHWAAWRRSLPGRRVWRTAEDLVVRQDGGERLRSRSLGTFSRWARSTPDRPLRIRVVGPTTLRVDARPLLSDVSSRTEPGWLVFRTDRRHWRSPLSAASVSQGIEMAGDGSELIGTRSRSVLVVDPGIHEIEILDPRGATLLRIYEERAQLNLAILPSLAPGALDWLAGDSPPPATSAIGCSSFGRLNICSRPLLVVPDITDITDSRDPVMDLRVRFDPELFGDQPAAGFAGAWPQFPPAAELPPADAEIDDILRSARDSKEIIRDTWLIAERNRQPYGRIARIGKLADLFPTDSMVQNLYDRAISNFHWKRITKASASAGVRLVPQALGAPRTPRSRETWPLLSASCQQSRRIRESGELVVTVENRKASSVTVEIENCYRTTRTARPASAKLEVDGEMRKTIQLDENTPRVTRRLSLDAGSHSIRLFVPSAPRGQTVGVRLVQDGRVINQTRSRAYHVAKPGVPVVMEIKGPTRIRIDQLRGDVTRTSYRSLPPGPSRIELTSDGHSEMLYRVTKSVRVSEEPTPRTPTPPRVAPTHPPLQLASFEEPPPESANLSPGPIRAGLEDGTWTATAKYFSRSTDDDDPDSNNSEVMGELRGTHRFLNRSWGFYSKTDLFVRPRQDGGPTFAGRAKWTWPTLGVWRGLERRAGLTTVLQPPTGGPNRLEALLGGQAEAALPHAITAKIRHRPSIAIFARWLSLGDRNGYPRANIDRDVFTPYKADHLYGLRLKDSLSLRPYRDVFTKFELGLQSNEDFNIGSPDRLSLGLSGAVLYQGLEIDAGYSWRHYFEDDDRNKDIDRHDLFLGVQLERWMHLARRWQVGVETRHEISRGTTSLILTLSLHFGRERGFRDFAPDSIRFRSERDLSRRRQTNSSRRRVR